MERRRREAPVEARGRREVSVAGSPRREIMVVERRRREALVVTLVEEKKNRLVVMLLWCSSMESWLQKTWIAISPFSSIFFFRCRHNKRGTGAGSVCPARPAITQTAKAQPAWDLTRENRSQMGLHYLNPNPPRMDLVRARPAGCGPIAIPSFTRSFTLILEFVLSLEFFFFFAENINNARLAYNIAIRFWRYMYIYYFFVNKLN